MKLPLQYGFPLFYRQNSLTFSSTSNFLFVQHYTCYSCGKVCRYIDQLIFVVTFLGHEVYPKNTSWFKICSFLHACMTVLCTMSMTLLLSIVILNPWRFMCIMRHMKCTWNISSIMQAYQSHNSFFFFFFVKRICTNFVLDQGARYWLIDWLIDRKWSE